MMYKKTRACNPLGQAFCVKPKFWVVHLKKMHWAKIPFWSRGGTKEGGVEREAIQKEEVTWIRRNIEENRWSRKLFNLCSSTRLVTIYSDDEYKLGSLHSSLSNRSSVEGVGWMEYLCSIIKPYLPRSFNHISCREITFALRLIHVNLLYCILLHS
jgi:hypothetical protein